MGEKYIYMDCGSHNVAKKEMRKFQCPHCYETGEYLWPIVGDQSRSNFCPKCGTRTEDMSWKSN